MLDEFHNQLLSSDADYLPVNAWCRVLTLGRWLQLGMLSIDYSHPILKPFVDAEKTDYSQTMAARLAGLPEGARSLRGLQAVLALLVEELGSASPEQRTWKLELLLACYLLFLRVATDREPACQALASLTTKTWKSLSIQEYSHVLALVTDAIAGADATSLDLPNLLGLSDRLLHDAPEGSFSRFSLPHVSKLTVRAGTLKVTQNHISQCLSLVVNRPEIWLTYPDRRLGVLDLLVRQCSDRVRPSFEHTVLYA